MVSGRISKDFKDDMYFFNDVNGDNMFTLAIKRKNINLILDVLKNLCQMSKDNLNAISKSIPLSELIKLNNTYIEPLLKYAMVKAISDKNQPLPTVFRQNEN